MRTRAAGLPRPRLALVRLEDRTVPAVTAALVNGVLTVLGDTADDTITLGLANGQITVSGVAQSFAAASVRTIVVDGGSGDDTITVNPAITTPCLLYGGIGNDTLTGGGWADQLYGGPGNDTLNGGPGNDLLYGGGGADTFTDTQGSNTVVQDTTARTANLSGVESQIVALVNQQRAANGLPALAVDARLTFAAQQHSANMAALSAVVGLGAAMSHTLNGSPQPTLTSRADYAGYDYQALAENTAYGYTGAADVMQAWMNSAGHRANILGTLTTQIGVGVRANAQGVLYFTEEFGNPAAGSAVAPPPGAPAPPPSVPT
jgi:uncharacterized protein YkwD